jgi:hypothetical protein
VTEADLQRAVTDLAELLGYEWAHFRPARTEKGWRTPVSGPLGAGWPDLVLVRERDCRLLFLELKGERGKLSAAQVRVVTALGSLESPPVVARWVERGVTRALPRVEVHLFRPSDLDPNGGRVREVLT